MADMKRKPERSSATMVGDLVGSREVTDRRGLHRRLLGALTQVNEELGEEVLDPLRITVGDEFQGRFATLGAALAATLRLRLALSPADIRFGIGWGEVTVLDDDGTQDGPGWWAARNAIEGVEQARQESATAQARNASRRAEAQEGPGEAEVNAALLCRDHLVGSLDDRSRRVLGGTMAGRTQAEIAEAEGVSPSAISQRVRRDGLGLILAAHDELRRVQ